jgi:predicted 3-demethylubiquinone-9 3-methyltransferase (glyoxalase superfamily)
MQKITPHLWFDKEAKEAADLYRSAFEDAQILNSTTINNTPSGTAEILSITLACQEFMLISAGPFFRFTPAISFLVRCATEQEVVTLWGKLIRGGSPLMELGAYPHSRKYGWLQDRYGLSWQVMLADSPVIPQKITPMLMFVREQYGNAEEAVNFYISVFRDAKVGSILRYGKGEGPDREGAAKFATFTLEGLEFAAIDSAGNHDFTFNESISFVVSCGTQDEIDYFWGKLSVVSEAERCGWLKDRFGVSWQIVPPVLQEMLRDKDPEKVSRVTEAFLTMRKLDIAQLQEAYAGKPAR